MVGSFNMKILQVIQFFGPKHGGSFTVAYELTKYLAKHGHEVTVITTDFELDENLVKSLEGVEVIPFRCQYNVGNLLLSTSMNNYLQEHITKYDIIHMHNFRTYQNITAHRYAKKYNIPYILQAHGSATRVIEKKGLKYIYDVFYGNKLLKDASSVVAVSNVEIGQYLKMNVSPEKVIIIPNGIDVNAFRKLPPEGTFREQFNISQNHIILFLGRLHRIKGLDFLIKSFSELITEIPDVILVLAGPDDGYESECRLLISKLNLSDKVIFPGYLNGTMKLSAYVDADVLVYPSIFEIFGLVPFEAILCGTPVIVTDDCGCGELIRESKSGYLVEYGDVDSLKEKMRTILENPQKDTEFVGNGKKFIYDNLSWEKIVKKMEENYENCIHNI